MATAEEYARWIVDNQDKQGTPEFETVAQAYQLARQQPVSRIDPRVVEGVKKEAANLVKQPVLGALKTAGNIGATLLAPKDAAENAIRRMLGAPELPNRRQQVNDAVASLGGNPEDWRFKTGEIATAIGATAGVPQAVAALVAPAAPAALTAAIASSGMRANQMSGLAGAGVRAAGGAIGGGAAAGLINPDDAAGGAMVGGVAPTAIKVAGAVGKGIGGLARGPQQSADQARAIADARKVGYVIPPSQANPSLMNRMLEGTAGKLTTAQNASAKNAATTARLVAEDLGLPPDTKITTDVLRDVRQRSAQAYEQIKSFGTLTTDEKFRNALRGIKGAHSSTAKDFPGLVKNEILDAMNALDVPSFKASSAIDVIKVLRDNADDAYASGNKSLGKAYRSAADAMEDLIERNLMRVNAERSLDGILKTGGTQADIGRAAVSNPAGKMLDDFRRARTTIAKTYTVEGALNKETGTINAAKLADRLNRGKPMTGNLERVARFAARFPRAVQNVEQMGSLPQFSPLDVGVGTMSAGIPLALTGNPAALLGASGVALRPAARSLALSPIVQNRLIQPPRSATLSGLLNPDLHEYLARSAPVLLADR